MAANTVAESLVRSWEKHGKSDFVKLCRTQISAITEKNPDVLGPDQDGLNQLLYSLLHHFLDGHLKLDQTVSGLHNAAELHSGVSSVLADVLSIVDMETVSLDDKAVRDLFLSLVPACKDFLKESLLKERLDNDTLEATGILPQKKTFQQKYVRLKTKLFYKQQKFNLPREESEGFAKLIVELQNKTDLPSSKTLQNIQALIGFFNLDPNRSLDIILEAFENSPHRVNFFVPLLQSYSLEQVTIAHMLGFKYQFFVEEHITTPKSLHNITALLLHHELISLEDVYHYLAPSDVEINTQYKKEVTNARQYSRKMSMAVLSAKEDKPDDKDKDNKDDKVIDNQKLGLCEALLNLGDWIHAKQLLDKLPEFSATANPSVAGALSSLIEKLLDIMYRKKAKPSGAKSKKCRFDNSGPNVLQAVSDFIGLRPVFQMCTYLGPYGSNHPLLLWKLTRLGRVVMADMKSKDAGKVAAMVPLRNSLLSVIESVLLPSLSLMECNASLSEEMWKLLKLFPYEVRYALYGRWKNYVYTIHPVLIRFKATVTDNVKYIMKRLTKDNVKVSGRQLGKLSHANPGVVFEYVLNQIQKYDNFIGPVVDAFKYLTSLSQDVLAYCMIEAIANPEKERMKHDNTNLSLWMQSLASFSGAIFKKYNIELKGLLQFVANQLKAGKSYDLLILREVIQKMAGIEITEEMTPDQLEASGGGELLKGEAGYFAQVRNMKRSSQRLKEGMMEDDLAISLCILMAQERFSIVYKHNKETHLKLVGKLFDQCQDTLVQMGGFLSVHLSIEDYSKNLPALDALVTQHHLNPEIAFFLHRSLCSNAILSKFDDLRKQDKQRSKEEKPNTEQRTQWYLEACKLVLSPLIETVKILHAPKVWDEISPQFYTTFWTLSMYDLHVPQGSYEKETTKIRHSIQALDDNKDQVSTKKRKEKERLGNLLEKMREEEKKQQEHVNRVKARLQEESETWFTARSTKNETITQFLQLGIFPRCCFTASDAIYCAKFVLLVHQLKTPNFSTLLCYDRVFQDITYTVASCSENEASRYGRFLCAMLETVSRWHSDKALYEKECGNYPGFVTVLRASGTEASNKADQLDYENFRHVCHKWQYKLTKAVVACLESQSYTQIRNTLILLIKILPHFPKVQNLGNVLEKRIDKICNEEKDKRPDIYVLALGYSGQLKGRRVHMIPEEKFHSKETKLAKPATNAATGAGAPTSATTKQESAKKYQTNGAEKNGPPAKKIKVEEEAMEEGETNDEPVTKDASSPAVGTKKADKKEAGKPIKEEGKDENDTAKVKVKEGKSRKSGEVKQASSKRLSKEGDEGKAKERKEAKDHKSHKESKEKNESKAEGKVKVQDRGSGDEKVAHKKGKKEDSEKRGQKEKTSKKEKESSQEDTKEERYSTKDRSQRSASEASNSSQGSGTSSRKTSPQRDSQERDHKRRKVEHPSLMENSEVVTRRRSQSKDRNEVDGEKERRRKSEKRRTHSEPEKDLLEMKRRRDEEMSPPAPVEKIKKKSTRTSEDGMNGDRTTSRKEHKESKTREKKDVEKLKEPRIRLKKESLDTDSDDDRHSSRKKRP
ncbi:THO complex subunit 2-like isoform X4 [Apostichopus japonicus]|uniref:THO complex subunit 2-like isoform X3 n=1 Tax=Stichopus japonicus TaxID=307972 RepID=UPI003AB31FF9